MLGSVSCRLSATGIGFLGHPVPATGARSSSRLAHRTRGPDQGCSRSTCARPGRGRVPPISRGRRCSHDRVGASGRRLPHPSGQPCTPAPQPIYPGLTLTRCHQRFTHVHPSGLPLACAPRMDQGPLGLSPELRTPPLPATHVRAGTGHEHCPGYVIDNTADLQPTRHLPHATSSRTTRECLPVPGRLDLRQAQLSPTDKALSSFYLTCRTNPRETRRPGPKDLANLGRGRFQVI